VSYLDRTDLAHVNPSEAGFDALGAGVEEGKAPAESANKYVSKGLTRSRINKGGQTPSGRAAEVSGTSVDTHAYGAGNVTALNVAGATALKAEPEEKQSPAQKIEHLNWADAKTHAKQAAAEKRAEARAKGYEGEACGECGNFTLLRNGTCMKCDTCGSTTGCS